MKVKMMKVAAFACLTLVGVQGFSQLPKITKPKIPSSLPSVPSGGSNSGGSVPVPAKDPSGLFSNVTDDPSAEAHRRIAAENLEKIDGWYKSPSMNYADLKQTMFENERELGYVVKLEPNVNRSKYDERYLPLKARAEKEIAAYEEAVKIEELVSDEFNAPIQFEKHNPMTFRTDSYGAHQACFCRQYASETKTLAEYEDAKKKYDGYMTQLHGYSDEQTQKYFSNMATCLDNGNKYAVWASTEYLQSDVVAYNTANWESKPKSVIERADDYLAALDRIENDNSIRLNEASKSSIASAKSTATKIKTDSETYISSGKYQAWKDKMWAAEIAKVFMPKAATKNASLEAGAIAYVKGEEFKENFLIPNDITLSSTLRTVTLTIEPLVEKNEWDLPKWQYHEVWVAFKDSEGKCYRVPVYASYTYKGGGTYATVPIWGADSPEEMACDNVMK
jgi:hypothetical protein